MICGCLCKTIVLLVIVAGLAVAGYYLFMRTGSVEVEIGDGCEGDGVTYTPINGKFKYTLIYLHDFDGVKESALLPKELVKEDDIKENWRIIMPYAKRNSDNKRAWGAVDDTNDEGSETPFDVVGYRTTSRRIKRIMKCEKDNHKIESTNIVIGGFGQGATAAYVTGFELDRPLLGLFGIHSLAPIFDGIRLSEEATKLKILHLHGNKDDKLTLKNWEDSRDRLIAVQTEFTPMKSIDISNIETKDFDVGNELVSEQIDAIAEYLEKRVKSLPEESSSLLESLTEGITDRIEDRIEQLDGGSTNVDGTLDEPVTSVTL